MWLAICVCTSTSERSSGSLLLPFLYFPVRRGLKQMILDPIVFKPLVLAFKLTMRFAKLCEVQDRKYQQIATALCDGPRKSPHGQKLSYRSNVCLDTYCLARFGLRSSLSAWTERTSHSHVLCSKAWGKALRNGVREKPLELCLGLTRPVGTT